MTKLQALALFACSAFVVAVFGLLILWLASLGLAKDPHDAARLVVSIFALLGLSIPTYVILTSKSPTPPAAPANI